MTVSNDHDVSISMNRRTFGGDGPPSHKYWSKHVEFSAEREDEYHETHAGVNQFIGALGADPANKCVPPEYDKWKVPDVEIDWRSVPDWSSDDREAFGRSLLLGQTLSGAQRLSIDESTRKLQVIDMTAPSFDKIILEINIPDPQKLPKPELGALSEEIKSQSHKETHFLYLICEGYVKSINGAAIESLMDIMSLAISSTIYRAKSMCGNNRPHEQDQGIRPTLKPPKHSSWPGGHAFECGALATLLYYLFENRIQTNKRPAFKDAISLAAKRIAYNREICGLHWRQDGIDGLAFGGELMKFWLESAPNTKDTYTGSFADFLRFLKYAGEKPSSSVEI